MQLNLARKRKLAERQRLKAMTAAAPHRDSKVFMVLSKDGTGVAPSINNHLDYRGGNKVINEEDIYSALPQASNPLKFNSEGSDQGTVGRGVSGLKSSAHMRSPDVQSSKKRLYQLNNATDETNKNNSAGRNTQKFTAPFAPKCHDVENERLQSLEGRIRQQLGKINAGTPGPGLYNSDVHTIDKKM